jgi:hypothetical protein
MDANIFVIISLEEKCNCVPFCINCTAEACILPYMHSKLKKYMCKSAIMYIMAQCNINLKIKNIWCGTIIAQDYFVIIMVEEAEVIVMHILLLRLI